MKKGLIKKFTAAMLAIAIGLTGIYGLPGKKANAIAFGGFGAGRGNYWPDQVFAPFVDIMLTNQQAGYNVNGTPYLPKFSEDTGIKYFNLGFIQSAGPVENGKIKWGFGGIAEVSETGNHEQYYGIKKSIKDLRAKGGDVTISFGGLNGTPFWEASQDVNVLYNTYKELVQGFGLTRIDLDIEGAARNKEKNVVNAKAIKKLQDETGVEVVLTVPVLPDGFTIEEYGLMDAYLSQGVDIKMVNVMAMCYGPATLGPGENYGTASVRVIRETMADIKECYKKYINKDISEAEAYLKVGITTSIGFEGDAHPIFTTEWTQLVVNEAINKKIGMTAFWSLNRDSQLQSNQGITGKYEHSKINLKFGSTTPSPNANFAPALYGVRDKLVGVNASFNPMAGVIAMDYEDGDISNKVIIKGTVNTNVLGAYNLEYSVTDSKGKTVTLSRKITVQANVPANTAPVLSGVKDSNVYIGEGFDPMLGISATDKEDGDISEQIVLNGKVDQNTVGLYNLSYTITDSDGVKTIQNAVIKVYPTPPYGAKSYNLGSVYWGGDYVVYNNSIYKAKYWTKGNVPGNSEQWLFIEALPEPNFNTVTLASVAARYNAKTGEANYDLKYDLNKDGIIDIYDLVTVARTM